MDKKSEEKWKRILMPQVLRINMLSAVIFIISYELLKDSIVDNLREFFWKGINDGKEIIDERYDNEVLTLDKNQLYASIKWLKGRDIISEEDIMVFNKIKALRNDFAHKLPKYLEEGMPEEMPDLFSKLISLINKIERWWIINFDLEIGPHYEVKNGKYEEINIEDFDLEKIMPGKIAILKLIIDIALGTDDEAEYFLNEFKKSGYFAN
jgi:hypothetical protein